MRTRFLDTCHNIAKATYGLENKWQYAGCAISNTCRVGIIALEFLGSPYAAWIKAGFAATSLIAHSVTYLNKVGSSKETVEMLPFLCDLCPKHNLPWIPEISSLLGTPGRYFLTTTTAIYWGAAPMVLSGLPSFLSWCQTSHSTRNDEIIEELESDSSAVAANENAPLLPGSNRSNDIETPPPNPKGSRLDLTGVLSSTPTPSSHS